MKRSWLFILSAILGLSLARARASVFDVQRTSFTNTGEQQMVVYAGRAIVYSVCIDSVSASAGANFKILNSTASNIPAVSTITVIDTTRTQIGCLSYGNGVFISSGLAYSNSGATPAFINMQWNPFNN